MTMEHKTFIETLSKKIGSSKEETSDMVEAFCAVLTEAVLNADTVTFPGFGSFEPRKRMERIAIHPSTGKRMLIPPKITISFRPSTLLKQKVRNHE